jgi:hypothetical protein
VGEAYGEASRDVEKTDKGMGTAVDHAIQIYLSKCCPKKPVVRRHVADESNLGKLDPVDKCRA